MALILLATGCAGKKPRGGGGGGGDGPGPGGGGGGGGRRQNQSQIDPAEILGLNDEIAKLKDERDELRRQLDQVFGPNGLNQNLGSPFNTAGGVSPDNFSAGVFQNNAPAASAPLPGGGIGPVAPTDLGSLAATGPATGGNVQGSVVNVGVLPGDVSSFQPSASRQPASIPGLGATHAVP